RMKEVIDSMTREVPSLVPFMIAGVVFGLTMAVFLLVSGIGLLNMKGWGRALAILFSLLTIAGQAGSLIYRLTYLNPALASWQKDFVARHGGQMEANPMGGNPALNNVVEILVTVAFLSYAVLLLVIMLMPSTGAAFRGETPGFPREDPHDRWGGPSDEEERWGR